MKTTPADEEPEDDGGGERGTAGFEHEHLFRISPTPGNTLPEGPSASHAQQDNWDDEIFEPPTSLCSNVTTPASSAPVLAQSRDNGAPSEPMSEAFLRWGIQTDQAAMGTPIDPFLLQISAQTRLSTTPSAFPSHSDPRSPSRTEEVSSSPGLASQNPRYVPSPFFHPQTLNIDLYTAPTDLFHRLRPAIAHHDLCLTRQLHPFPR